MQRTTKADGTVKEKSTRYFVNGVECRRDNVYQTILDNQFYIGMINIEKKSRSKVYKKNVTDKEGFSNVNFSLDTKKFVDKFSPISEEYKLLVEKMIHLVDMAFAASRHYDEHSTNLRIATHNCFTYFNQNTMDFKIPYIEIQHELCLKNWSFLFDTLTWGLNQQFVTGYPKKLPDINLDMSSVKESWDETWTNNQKSQYLKKYLSTLLKQIDLLSKDWTKKDVFVNKSAKIEIQHKFDHFKEEIKSLQKKKKLLDASLPDVRHQSPSLLSNISSLFHHKEHKNETNDSTLIKTPSNSMF